MANKIQIRRGMKKNLPQLSPGEFGFAVDTEELFVGNGDGNKNIPVNTTKELIATTSGTGSAYTITLTPAPTELYVGMEITMVPHTTSTSKSVTLNVNGLGAKPIYIKSSDTSHLEIPKTSSFLFMGKPVRLMYDGGYWIADLNYIITIDSSLSTNSTNPVQNKIVTQEISDLSNRISVIEERLPTVLYGEITSGLSIYSNDFLHDGLYFINGKNLGGSTNYPEADNRIYDGDGMTYWLPSGLRIERGKTYVVELTSTEEDREDGLVDNGEVSLLLTINNTKYRNFLEYMVAKTMGTV